MRNRWMAFIAGVVVAITGGVFAQDWYTASGEPVARSLLNSAALRTEFASIESDIADKLPVLTGNGGKLVAVNSGGTALEAVSTGVAITSGGTGATTAAGARTNLGLAIGTDVQAWDAELDELAALTDTDSNFIVGNGSAWTAESGATARTSLGLGSIATVNSPVPIANGGTAATTAGAARTNLGLGSLATLSSINNGNWSGTDLAVANGGTGASDATTARSNLGAAATSHTHAASDTTSGTFANARISQSSVTQHEAAISHDSLSGFVADEHRLITVSTSAPSGTPATGTLWFIREP